MNKELFDIFDIIEQRASCRSFQEKELPSEIIEQLLEAACKAPSSGGFQNYSIIKVTSKEKKEQLAKYSRRQSFIAKAPVCLVFCIDYRRIKKMNEVEPFPFMETANFTKFWMSVLDTGICAQTLCLAAETLGLGSVFIGDMLNECDKVSELLKLPEYVLPSIMVALGYPKTTPKPSKKYGAKLLVHEEEYAETDTAKLSEQYKEKYSGWKMKSNQKTIQKIAETAERYRDSQYAEQCRRYMTEQRTISPYQYWFGCFYLEEEGFLDTVGFIEFMKRKGFSWIL